MRTSIERRVAWVITVCVGLLTAASLLIAAQGQIYDSNLYQLSAVPAILNGDHPYRDFFEWGAPLTAYLSAAVQLLVGYRLIGEFAMQWTLIVAGAIVSFRLALQLSGSLTAAVVLLPVQLLLLLQTPTYHFLKLFVFPVMLALSFRYLRQPTLRNSALLGAGAAIGFLLRNDFGVWLAALWLLTLAVSAWQAGEGPRSPRVSRHALAFGLAAVVTLAPWMALVETGEGMLRYVATRTQEFEEPNDWPLVYRRLLDPRRFPVPNFVEAGIAPGRVEFAWEPGVSEGRRKAMVLENGLTPVGSPASDGRQRFDVANLDDTRLLRLRPFVRAETGFDWTRLRLVNSSFATAEGSILWLQWVTLLAPLVMVIVGIRQAGRPGASTDDRMDGARCIVTGGFLVILLSVLLREPSYIMMFAPLVSAAAARLLVTRTADAASRRPRLVPVVTRLARMAAVVVTLLAAVSYSADTILFAAPKQIRERIITTLTYMMTSPPMPKEPPYRYIHECSDPGDRLLISGPTPYQISYYTQRPMAGGHFLWSYRWQSDEIGQERSLALLKRQSVPFVFSTTNSGTALGDFAAYPRVREYLAAHYVELPGTNGRLLVDSRRRQTGSFGDTPLPCFATSSPPSTS